MPVSYVNRYLSYLKFLDSFQANKNSFSMSLVYNMFAANMLLVFVLSRSLLFPVRRTEILRYEVM